MEEREVQKISPIQKAGSLTFIVSSWILLIILNMQEARSRTTVTNLYDLRIVNIFRF